MAESSRLRRARQRVDEAVQALDYGPSYPVTCDDVTYLHIDCSRCGASVRVDGMNPWKHWRSHHRLRAALAEFAEQQRISAGGDRHPEVTIDPRPDVTFYDRG